MDRKQKQRNIAYRCPECASSIFGILGKFALSAGMLRLKCSCESSPALDILPTSDGKIKLSVPCLFCKENHGYVLSEALLFERESFNLSCPYSGMDIAFIGSEEKIQPELSRTEDEIRRMLASFEAEEISDIQPKDMGEDEVLPDPAAYDVLRFLLKDLESDGRVKCLCNDGRYDLRFTDSGIQACCESCGATYTFPVTSAVLAEEYLSTDELILK